MSALPNAIQREADSVAAYEAAVAQQPAPADTVQPSAETKPEPQPAPPAPPSPPAEDWQQKYRTLQGMHAQMRGELQAKVVKAESDMAALRQQVEALTSAKRTEEAREANKADPKDVEAFGADLVEMVQRYAERVFRALAAQFGEKQSELETRLAAVENGVTGVTQKTEATLQQQYFAALTKLVPDWQDINADPLWLQWLAEVDSIYGVDRQAALDSARNALDVERTAAVFQAFKAAHQRKPQSLAEQVSPSGAASGHQATAQRPSKVWSSREVEKFYGDVIRGRYSEAEAARIEAEINTAAAEGRIQ